MKITIEGYVGEGKATIANLLAKTLAKNGFDVSIGVSDVAEASDRRANHSDKKVRTVARKHGKIEIDVIQLAREPKEN